MRPQLLATLVTISPVHPAEVLLTFTTGNVNLRKTAFLSFEVLVMKSMQPAQSLFIATVYRPPLPYTAFLTEFPEFLSDLVVMADNIQIFDDFTIHMEKSTGPLWPSEPSSTQWVLSNMSLDLLTVTVILWT